MTTIRRDQPFAKVLAVWAAAMLIFWLAFFRLIEVLPAPVFKALFAAIALGAPLVILSWTLWRASMRQGSWLAPPVVVVGAIVLLVAGIPLHWASIYLNFWAHRAAYDAVVADVKAGRISTSDGPEGKRYGVSYNLSLGPPGVVGFIWWWDFDIGSGVIYDENDCPAQPERSLPQEKSARPQSNGADPPTMKHAGRLGSTPFVLDGHYCYHTVP